MERDKLPGHPQDIYPDFMESPFKGQPVHGPFYDMYKEDWEREVALARVRHALQKIDDKGGEHD